MRNCSSCVTRLAAALMVMLCGLTACAWQEPSAPVKLRPDDAPQRVVSGTGIIPGSHVKVYIPSLPYLYTSHAVNGALIKPSDNAQGWEYDMAVSHEQIDDTTYEFKLREGVVFQDETPFDADAVVMNMESFKEHPTLYSKIDKVFDRCEKIDDYTVRFHLKEKYGCFMNDAIWMQFYSKTYLETNQDAVTGEKVGWNGKANCPNLSMAGPYGLGPYILTEGYIEGNRHTPKTVLKANPLYYDKRSSRVETITIYTDLDSVEAKDQVLYKEGELDIAFIAPEFKVETILSPYAKLVTSNSTDNIAIHINMINGNPKLRETKVRRALNEALNQQNLLHFVFDNEGVVSPTPASPFFPGVAEVAKELKAYSEVKDPQTRQVEFRETLDGLELRVLTQRRFMPLWRGIETQLRPVGVKLLIDPKTSETDIFGPLLQTHAGHNTVPWDLLVWGNDDWFFNHPFAAFFVYRTDNVWSTVYEDKQMNALIDDMFRASVLDPETGRTDPEFAEICRKIMQRAYDEAYMLVVPTPNKVFAVNKEVVFKPYKMACFPLWKIEITDQHWSLRKGPYPEQRKQPVQIQRTIIENRAAE